MKLSRAAPIIAPDIYNISHEGGHYAAAKILREPVYDTSNFGNTPMIEGAESIGMLPNNGSLSEIIRDPMGNIIHGADGFLESCAITSSGHLAAIGVASIFSIIGNKTQDLKSKLIAGSMGAMQLFHLSKDIVTEKADSDIFKLGGYLNVEPYMIGGGLMIASMASMAYAWLPEIKSRFSRVC